MKFNPNYRIIFVAGTHGVGKTTFCSVLSQYIDSQTVSASDIIKKQIDLNNNKSVKNIDNNQNTLIEGISKLKINCRYLLLDGHFCLLDSDYNIKYIPIAIFHTLNPIGIILLKCDPNQIFARLLRRDGQYSWSISIINNMQSKEYARAFKVASKLDVPILTFDTEKYPSEEGIGNILKTLSIKTK